MELLLLGVLGYLAWKKLQAGQAAAAAQGQAAAGPMVDVPGSDGGAVSAPAAAGMAPPIVAPPSDNGSIFKTQTPPIYQAPPSAMGPTMTPTVTPPAPMVTKGSGYTPLAAPPSVFRESAPPPPLPPPPPMPAPAPYIPPYAAPPPSGGEMVPRASPPPPVLAPPPPAPAPAPVRATFVLPGPAPAPAPRPRTGSTGGKRGL